MSELHYTHVSSIVTERVETSADHVVTRTKTTVGGSETTKLAFEQPKRNRRFSFTDDIKMQHGIITASFYDDKDQFQCMSILLDDLELEELRHAITQRLARRHIEKNKTICHAA